MAEEDVSPLTPHYVSWRLCKQCGLRPAMLAFVPGSPACEDCGHPLEAHGEAGECMHYDWRLNHICGCRGRRGTPTDITSCSVGEEGEGVA
jgi:hypothetical protein